jgi:hypothetical protein
VPESRQHRSRARYERAATKARGLSVLVYPDGCQTFVVRYVAAGGARRRAAVRAQARAGETLEDSAVRLMPPKRGWTSRQPPVPRPGRAKGSSLRKTKHMRPQAPRGRERAFGGAPGVMAGSTTA